MEAEDLRMATEAQNRTNRANARKSTRPRTHEGRARSSRNALTHGFRSRIQKDYPDLESICRDLDYLNALERGLLPPSFRRSRRSSLVTRHSSLHSCCVVFSPIG